MSIAGKASQFYSGFSPLSIPSCVQWLDATDATTVVLSGSNVTRWRDKSGTGTDVSQAATSNVPVYQASLINSLPALNFQGNGGLQSGNFAKGSNITVFVAAMMKSTAGSWGTVWGHFSVGRHDDDIQLRRRETTSTMSWHTNNDNVSMLTTYTNDIPVVYSLTMRNGTEMFMQQTDSSLGTVTVTSTQSLTWQAGNAPIWVGRSDTNENINSYIGEIIYYQSVLPTTQRQAVESYLSRKWGVGSFLPISHAYRAVPPFLRTFHPLDITECSLWLDAADPSTVTLTGSNVTLWSDKSGRGCNATGVNNPTYSNGVVNFLRTSSQYFTLPNSTLPISNSSYAYFLVCSFGDDANKGGLIGGGSYGASRNVFALRNGGGEVARSLLTYWWGDDFFTSSNAYAMNTNFIAGTTYDASASTLRRFTYVNGAVAGSNTNTGNRTQTISNNTIGVTNGTEYLTGTIGEILVYSNALSLVQRQQVEGYLARKWSLRGDLSSTHGFKLYPVLGLPFSPLQIPDCVLWLDAADAGTFTFSSGSNVSVWRSKTSRVDSISTWESGANPVRLAQGNLGNGLPTLQYASVGYTSNLLGYSGSTPETICMVGNNNSTTTYTGSTRWVQNPPNSSPFSWGGSHVLNVRAERVRAELQGVGGLNIDITGRAKMTISIATATALNVFESGAPAAGNPFSMTLNQTNGNLRIGTPGAGVTNEFGEILYYSRALTVGERQALEGYFAQKWGFKGVLPSTHPFKTIAA